ARRLTGERPASRVTSRRRRRARRGRPSPYTTLFRSRAKDAAIYTEIGAAPRGHDHRARWDEMLDTCTGSTGTLESGVPVHLAERSEEHTSELQSPDHLVRRLLLEQNKEHRHMRPVDG